jgi:hypothetical protein
VTVNDTRDPTNAGGDDRALPYDLGARNSLPDPIALEPSTLSSPKVSPRDTGARQRPGSCGASSGVMLLGWIPGDCQKCGPSKIRKRSP